MLLTNWRTIIIYLDKAELNILILIYIKIDVNFILLLNNNKIDVAD